MEVLTHKVDKVLPFFVRQYMDRPKAIHIPLRTSFFSEKKLDEEVGKQMTANGFWRPTTALLVINHP